MRPGLMEHSRYKREEEWVGSEVTLRRPGGNKRQRLLNGRPVRSP
jgi:hypothetical protein